MAQIQSNRSVENNSEQLVLNTLAEGLPEDYIIVPNVQVERVPEIDLIVIRKDVIITIEVKDWYNTIQGDPYSDTVQVGPHHWRNPIRQADKQAKILASYLFSPKQANLIFEDPRIVYSLRVRPVVIFSNPEADIQIKSTDNVTVLALSEAVEKLSASTFGWRRCNFTSAEQEKLALLFLNKTDDLNNNTLNMEEKISLIEGEAPKTTPALAQKPDAPKKAISDPIEVTEEKPQTQQETLSRFARPIEDSLTDTLPNPQRAQTTPRRRIPSIKQFINGVLNISDEVERLTDFRSMRHSDEQTLQQPQLARALENELEDKLHHLMKETIAHNDFSIYLSNEDFEHIEPFKRQGELELQEHISHVSKARDYKLLAPVQVKFIKNDEFSKGTYEITSIINEAIVVENEVEVAENKGPYLEYIVNGERFPLNQSSMTLGRSRQNDICVGAFDAKKVVSRKHAIIRQEEDGYVIYDGLESSPSTYGTFVNGERLQTDGGCLLKNGQKIILGPTQHFNPHQPLQGSLQFVFHTH